MRIEHIYKAPSFRALFNRIEKDAGKLGNTDELLQGLRCWWDEEKETTEGVLAFHVVVV